MPDQIGYFASLKNAAGKVFTYLASITLTGTDGKTLTVPASLTLPDILAAGALPYGSAAGVLSSLVAGAANLKLSMNAAGTAPEWATGIKVGTFTRDTAAANGNVSITGTGFKPSLVVFLAVVSGTSEVSIGRDDGATANCLINNHIVAAGAWIPSGGGASIYFKQAAAEYALAYISSMDADGFTLAWTKTAGKTGTGTIYYIAFR